LTAQTLLRSDALFCAIAQAIIVAITALIVCAKLCLKFKKDRKQQKNQFFSFGICYSILYIKALAPFIHASRTIKPSTNIPAPRTMNHDLRIT
jgi:hypothetical protein